MDCRSMFRLCGSNDHNSGALRVKMEWMLSMQGHNGWLSIWERDEERWRETIFGFINCIIKYLQWIDNQHEYGFTVNAFSDHVRRCNGLMRWNHATKFNSVAHSLAHLHLHWEDLHCTCTSSLFNYSFFPIFRARNVNCGTILEIVWISTFTISLKIVSNRVTTQT